LEIKIISVITVVITRSYFLSVLSRYLLTTAMIVEVALQLTRQTPKIKSVSSDNILNRK